MLTQEDHGADDCFGLVKAFYACFTTKPVRARPDVSFYEDKSQNTLRAGTMFQRHSEGYRAMRLQRILR